MNRLENLFQHKKDKILNIYTTAGFPKLESTMQVMTALQHAGVDIIELGMPYSDPLADGETIQHSSAIALQNGMTIEKLFTQLTDFRKTIRVPVVLMGYMNPVLQYGFENFCANAAKVGIDGLILPDLPAFEFETMYQSILEKYNLNFIFLVTPETAEQRVRQLDKLSSGFLYAVSSSSTTGGTQDFDAVAAYLQRLQSYELKNPVLVGFGIKDSATFLQAVAHSQGAIIGSAFVKHIEVATNLEKEIERFVSAIVN